MRIASLTLLLAVASIQFAADAQVPVRQPEPMDKTREREAFDETTKTYAKPGAQNGSAFEAQCVGVLGLEAYCGCLGKDMPAGVGFDNFVVVLSRSKQENGYDKLDSTSKRAYDAIPAIRDSCAAGATGR